MADTLKILVNLILDDYAKYVASDCHAFSACPQYEQKERLCDEGRWKEQEALCFMCCREELTEKYGINEWFKEEECSQKVE